MLSDFGTTPEYVAPGMRWTGFTDRVMGGVSEAELALAEVAGRRCLRLTGRVTRDRGGGFIQMALDLAPRGAVLDASGYDGLELWLHGNDEDYNVHLRTPDCRWYDQSYRHSLRAPARWQCLRIPWTDFAPHDLGVPLARARLQRVAVLGWMREFVADVALASVALYVG